MDYQFTLYIAGRTPNAKAAVAAVRDLLEKSGLHNRHVLNVVDVVRNPEEAEANCVFATPTIAKIAPEPCRKVVGDLRDMRMVFLKLGVKREDLESSFRQDGL
ncbi:MAG: circadian clock KaiB family protein [Eubacteriales bacterium]|nr:circadian clock KaiB family protein [Eubacteriales bacterium]MDD3082545.1 circadian clock KaiB family protein [Desulfobacterales bacterium]